MREIFKSSESNDINMNNNIYKNWAKYQKIQE